jgi:hypothetical protein
MDTGCSFGHVAYEIQPDDSGEIQAFDPGSITIGAAVILAFKIAYQNS